MYLTSLYDIIHGHGSGRINNAAIIAGSLGLHTARNNGEKSVIEIREAQGLSVQVLGGHNSIKEHSHRWAWGETVWETAQLSVMVPMTGLDRVSLLTAFTSDITDLQNGRGWAIMKGARSPFTLFVPL